MPRRTSLEAAGRVDSTDYAIIFDRRERHVELWDLDRREPAGAPLVLTEQTSVWACALGWAGMVPAAYIGLSGRDASSSSSSVYGIRDWPRLIQAISGSVPLSAAMTGEGDMPLLSLGRADGTIRRYAWTDDGFAPIATVTAHDAGIDGILFTDPVGGVPTEVTGGRDGMVCRWRRTAADGTVALPTMYGRSTHVVVATPNVELLIGQGPDERLDRWDVRTGERLGPPPAWHHRARTWLCRLSRPGFGGAEAVVGWSDGSVTVLDPIAGSTSDTFATPASNARFLRTFRTGGSRRVLCASFDGGVSCYDLDRRMWVFTDHRLSEGDRDTSGTELVDIHGEPRILHIVHSPTGTRPSTSGPSTRGQPSCAPSRCRNGARSSSAT